MRALTLHSHQLHVQLVSMLLQVLQLVQIAWLVASVPRGALHHSLALVAATLLLPHPNASFVLLAAPAHPQQ